MSEPLDISKTKRIVLLIDLHPLLSFENPNANPYISAVIAAVKRLLNFTPLSNSLFAFRFFFSSLSPIRSASALHRLFPDPHLNSLSFNSFSQTLASLCKILSNFPTPLLPTELCGGSTSVLHTANLLLQLIHDYAWESEIDSSRGGDSLDVKVIKQNSVFLFTRVGGNLGSFFNNMSLDGGNQDLDDSDGALLKFCDAFAAAKDAFVIRDIHLSWFNVVCRSENGQEEECGARLNSLVKGIRQLGWGFYSTDSIILGSAILPFGLIYPIIGVSLNLLNLNVSCKRARVQLSLEILDVNGDPLECSCCDLELVNLTNMPRDVSQDMLIASEPKSHLAKGSYEGKTISSHFLVSTTKLCIKAVHKCADGWKTSRCPYDIIMVQEFYGDLKKHTEKPRNILFVDKALDMVSRELNDHSPAHTLPFWQIILSFLYKEGYWASVSLSTRNGDTVKGILKPFTAYSALLIVVKDDSLESDGCTPSNFGKINNGDHYDCVDTSNMNGSVGSQGESASGCEPLHGKKKKHRRTSARDKTWSSFYKAATCLHEFDLGEVYFASGDGNKKLKFLKCWLKQVAKINQGDQRTLYTPKDSTESSAFPSLTSESSHLYEGAESISGSETSDSFFSALQRIIQHGLVSGMDLQTLAERLVKSSIIWSRQACVKSRAEDVQLHHARLDNSWGTLFMEVLRLLLKDPKEMKSSDSDTTSEMIVREYELQVLLRMELLQLDIIGNIEEPSKQKLEKQICSLLEIIQYLIDGGIHGNVSLFEYVERTIKTRYYNSLQDSVDSIYAQMDLLPFGDEDETQALLFNSEDSSQSCKDTKEMPEKVEIQDKDQCLLAEDDAQLQKEHTNVSPEGLKSEEHERKLNEARKRRERSRRFVSYSSRMPDLQRVWAPKNPKPAKGRSDSFHKESKRKCRESGKFTVVSETPMTGMKRPSSTSSGKEGYAQKDPGTCSNSVSKALFLN